MFNFQAFIRRKWAEYSNSSGQKGTVIDELAVKPTGLVMSEFYSALVSQKKVNDISNWKDMTDEELDFFGNKFFFPRIDGDYTFGSVRIYFDEKENILISEDVRFVSEDGYKFKAVQPGTISSSSFKNSDDRFALYYVDVQIIAVSKGNQYNIVAGKITSIEDADFIYKSITNLKDMINGSKYETNEEYYERMMYSINDRSMMNKRSMFAKLPEFFPVVRGMYIVAPGDKYMTRDLVSGTDISTPTQKADYLGKISGENLIKHIAFYGIYPPETGDAAKEDWGPFSITTEYDYPLTIEESDTTASISASEQSGDPGLHGYPLDQEYTDDNYKGLYFDDYKTVTEIITSDLFNIENEDVGLDDIVTPSSEWVYGAQGKNNGDLGQLYDGYEAIDLIKFNRNTITLSTGAKNSINIGKDIEKRIGIKLTGTIILPTSEEDSTEAPNFTNIQFMLGGINSNIADGYTGVGFGIRLTNHYDGTNNNIILYMAHGEKYGQAQVFAADDDIENTEVGDTSTDGHISITDLGALAETSWMMQENIEYEFEFIIHDDLKLTLYLNKLSSLDEDESKNIKKWTLPSTVLNVFSQELFNKNTDHYGTTMKISLDAVSSSSYSWIINDLKAFDTQQSRATSLFAINVKDIEDPATISLRAFGSGSVDNILTDGFMAYLWDKESSSIASGMTELTEGSWIRIPSLSNPTGSKDVLSSMLTYTIQNLERYQVNSRFGKNIFLMLTATGTSKAKSLHAGEIEDDIQSQLKIDYIKLESDSLFYYHSNNKSDIYLSTIKNSEELESTSIVLTKTSGENFFEMSLDTDCKMPIDEIISVTIGTTAEENESLSDTEYSVAIVDETYKGSSKEVRRIILDETDADTITVEYTTYPEIENIQDFFDDTEYEKIYGDILIKHKIPVYLSFTVFFTGNINEDQLIDEIRTYVDENIDGTFSTREFISYLYNKGFVNNVQEPIEISYSLTNDKGETETGTFTDTLTIRNIDYFRISDLSVSRL